MKNGRNTTEGSPPKVPAYIVTFSDMVTLLLTFFVMLLSLASVQDPELFNMGRGSFFQSIREMGLGTLWGRKPKPAFGNEKIKYFISTPDESFADRSIDAREERARRIFKRVNSAMTTMPSQIVAEKVDFAVTSIRFSRGGAILGESEKNFLSEFCHHLRADVGSKSGALYVLGLAGDATTEKEEWILSAIRAQAAAEFLRDGLRAGSDVSDGPPAWPVYWWGAGSGGDWVEKDSPISKQSQILIAVLSGGD